MCRSMVARWYRRACSSRKSTGSESLRSPTEPVRLPWCNCEQKKVKVASWQVCLRWLGAVALHSRSRSEDVNIWIRARMLNRPDQQCCSTTGRSKKDAKPHDMLTPTSLRNEHGFGRNAEVAPVHARLKQARSSASLQSMFQDALDNKQVDASKGFGRRRCYGFITKSSNLTLPSSALSKAFA